MAATVSNGPNIRDVDRLVFTLFLAIVVHVVLVLTDFIAEEPAPAPSTIAITLSRFSDEVAPDEYDYLAQTNQIGGGILSDRSIVTSPTPSNDLSKPDMMTKKMSPAAQQKTDYQRAIVSTISEAPRKLLHTDELSKEFETLSEDQDQSILETSLEMAQLEATYAEQIQNYSKRPRIKRLAAADTMQAVEARYVEQVIHKIERIGRLNYPTRNGNKLYGKPRVAISIYLDGTIREIEILETSGSIVLDSKTKEIVHRAAPFGPFPQEIRKDADVLQLIRTFSYHREGITSS